MRKSSKNIRTQADYYLKMMSANQLNVEISKNLVSLSEDGDAMSNLNQIEHLTRILFYLKYEYKPNNKNLKKMLNYQKLMDRNPTSYGKMTNKQGQEIEFFEHPIFGDETEVIVVCHELKLASYSTFFETYDMTAEHGEYQPSFVDGQLQIG